MAHDLATTNGRTAMAFFGETPWHGLGTKLENPATAAEAIAAAGLDYTVALTAMHTPDGTEVPKRKTVVRSDTGAVLGVVGAGYVPIQNAQAFGFLDAVVGDAGLRYHTAGALGKAAASKERALHVIVPEAAHTRARMAALASKPRLPFKAFIAKLLSSAMPIIAADISAAEATAGEAEAANPPTPSSPGNTPRPADQQPGPEFGIDELIATIERKP